jgi:predicted negative regulator of RcsB-dependent stress response
MSVDQDPAEQKETEQANPAWGIVLVLFVVLVAAILVAWIVYSSHALAPR